MESKQLIINPPIPYEYKVDESKFPLAKISQNFDDGSTVTEKLYCFSGNGDVSTSSPEAFFVFEDEYKSRTERLLWDDKDRFDNLPRELQGSAKVTWTDEIATDNAIVSAPAQQKYKLAIKKLTETFCGGDAPGDVQRDAFWNSPIFRKCKHENMFQYLNRMNRIFHLDSRLLHKMYPNDLNDQEKKRIIFKGVPYQWKENFRHTGMDLTYITMKELVNYMQKEKQAADLHDANRTKNRQQEMRKITGHRRSRKRKSQSTNDEDKEEKTDEGYNQCRKHPQNKHTWEECFLNPRNPNNKLNNKRQKKSKFHSSRNNNATANNGNNQSHNQPPVAEQRAAESNNNQSPPTSTDAGATLDNIWE
ncbi:predicted protein [Chaetoceros tenuissimus]|uniref:Uncharacterized protein n=1 Tax=Chaetoceros tenuissimus TaxID=426638 RepID=A0AAD3CP04_9STRA|nr:predicted protein [Chaetoceros tenuissimus]